MGSEQPRCLGPFKVTVCGGGERTTASLQQLVSSTRTDCQGDLKTTPASPQTVSVSILNLTIHWPVLLLGNSHPLMKQPLGHCQNLTASLLPIGTALCYRQKSKHRAPPKLDPANTHRNSQLEKAGKRFQRTSSDSAQVLLPESRVFPQFSSCLTYGMCSIGSKFFMPGPSGNSSQKILLPTTPLS